MSTTPDSPAAAPAPGAPGRISELARRLAARVRLLGAVALLAALTLWGTLLYPFPFTAWWHWVLALTALALLAAPAAVFLFTHLALHALIILPTRARAAIAESRGRAGRAAGEVRTRRRWWMGRTAWELWRLVAENRELVLGSAGLVRLVNPLTLVAVAAAVALTPLLVLAALVALVVVVL